VTDLWAQVLHAGPYRTLQASFVHLLSWDQSSSTSRDVSAKDVLGIAGHFEKMLYDNAQLARVYLHAWQGWRSNRTILSWRRGCWPDIHWVLGSG
jgi:hypothetical protein